MRIVNRTLVVVLAAALSATTAYGAILQDLIDGETLTNGDKVFSDFFVIPVGIGDHAFDPATVEVTPIEVGGNLGLLFASLVPGAPIITAGPGGYIDVLFGFDVTVTDPEWSISDIDLTFEASAPAGGFAQIVETALVGPVVVGQIQVQTPTPMSAHLDLLPQSYPALHIVKDALVLGGSDEATHVWSFEQTFSQIPEPTTLALLGMGAVLFWRPRRLTRLGAPLAVALAVIGVLAGSQNAQAIPLQTLIDTNGTITQDGKVFSDFTFNVDSAQGSYIGSAAGLDVSGITLGDEDGLRFAGGIAAFSNLVANSELTVTIGYKVTAPSPIWLTDASLGFNGAVTTADASATVTENIYATNLLVGQLAVAAPLPLSDHQLLAGMYQEIDVLKTISVNGGRNGVASISFVNQTYSEVPEPATVALLALGGFLVRRRVG